MQNLQEKQKIRVTRQQIREITPLIGLISMILIKKSGVSVLGLEKYGWEARDTLIFYQMHS